MLEFIKYASVAFTATTAVVTGWMQYEKFRLDGEWQIDTCTETADLSTFEGLHLAWRVFLSDDPLAAPVVGNGEKVEEAFKPIAPRGRFPVSFVGTKEINRVSLTGRFEGARRASTGRFELAPTLTRRTWSGYLPFYQRNVNVLEGTFALTAGNARGTARAVRLIEGEPVAAEPFVCEGAITPIPPAAEDAPEPVLEADPVEDSADET
ncbi:MAG: hypothetical protein NXH88_16590 [Hyphomonas sp.]|nr:hypothetical protein [Hyphomonas sp.]